MEEKRAVATTTTPQVYNDAHSKGYRMYDERFITTKSYQHYKDNITSLLDTLPGNITVLDAGCGTGRFFHLFKNVGALTGIDYSADMLRYAKNPLKAEEIDLSKISLLHGSILNYNFGEQRFDLIYSIGVLGEHIPFTLALCNKLYDLLNSNGKVFFTVVDLNSRKNIKRKAAEAAYHFLPKGMKKVLDKRWETNYMTRNQLDSIVAKSKFKSHSITLHNAEDPAWKGAHLECIAIK